MNAIDPVNMTGESLRDVLISLVRTKGEVSTTVFLKWKSRIDEIVNCYKKYVYTVCGESMDETHHLEKLNEFKNHLRSWKDLGTIACTTDMMYGYIKPSLWLKDKMNPTGEVGYSKFIDSINRLNRIQFREKCKDPYPGLRIVEERFQEPYLQCSNIELITIAVCDC